MIDGVFLVALFLGQPVAFGGPVPFSACQKLGGQAVKAVAARFADPLRASPKFRGERLRAADVTIVCTSTRPPLVKVSR